MRFLLRKTQREQIWFHRVWTSGRSMWGTDHLCCLARLCEIVKITEVEQVSIGMKNMTGVNGAVLGRVRLVCSCSRGVAVYASRRFQPNC